MNCSLSVRAVDLWDDAVEEYQIRGRLSLWLAGRAISREAAKYWMRPSCRCQATQHVHGKRGKPLTEQAMKSRVYNIRRLGQLHRLTPFPASKHQDVVAISATNA